MRINHILISIFFLLISFCSFQQGNGKIDDVPREEMKKYIFEGLAKELKKKEDKRKLSERARDYCEPIKEALREKYPGIRDNEIYELKEWEEDNPLQSLLPSRSSYFDRIDSGKNKEDILSQDVFELIEGINKDVYSDLKKNGYGPHSTKDFSNTPCFPKVKDHLFVYDQAEILTEQEEEFLNGKLATFTKETSNVLVVLTTPKLCGYDYGAYTYTFADEVGVGREDLDNGIVLMVKPKEIDGVGETFIAVGNGLQGVIPDIIARRDIVNEELIPHFKRKDYYGGIDRASDVMMRLAKGEINYGNYYGSSKGGSGFKFKPEYFFFGCLILFIIIFVYASYSGNWTRRSGFNKEAYRKRKKFRRRSFWDDLFDTDSSTYSSRGRKRSSSRSSYWDDDDDSSSGSSWDWGSSDSSSSSSSGGGFGGFGGGGFDGGGAGGKW